MPTSLRNSILDNMVAALQGISGAPNYFYTLNPVAVSRVVRPVDQVSVFPSLFVTEGSETRKWQTVGPQLLTNSFDVIIWGYARADAAVAPDATHAKEALIHDVDLALASAFNASQLGGSIVDIAPSGSTIKVETDEGLAALLATPDVGVFKMTIPVIYRQAWGVA